MFLNPLLSSRFPRYRYFLAFAALALLSACGADDSLDATDPGARTVPQNVTLTAGTRMNELSWRGVSGARGYTVFWATEPGVTPVSGTAIQTQRPYLEHRGLANDTTYYYVITSDTGFGQSAPSAMVEGTPRATRPARPGDLALQAGNGRITLRWDAVPGATHYTLYWQEHAGVGTDENAGESTGESTRIERVVSPFVHPGLENGRDYFYRLVAENAHGAGEASEEHSAVPLAPPPSAPQITRAEVAAGQVTLYWQHTGAASQYTLLWDSNDPLDNEGGENTPSLTQVTSPYTHAPLLDGQTYYYRVRTRNGDGVSALSNLVQVTPPGEASVAEPDAVPAVPTGLTVSLENGQLSLDWPPVAGALGYNLYWLSGETGEVTTEAARLTQIQPPYTHIPLNNGTLYRYRLSALNDHGESALSAEVNGVPQVVIPGVPAGVQALAGDASVLVRWDPVQGATGYTLTVNDGGSTNTLTDVRSPYRITDLSNATTYQIQLQAQNTQGLSEPSAPVSATPREPVPNTPGDLVARPGNASVLLQWTAATPQNADDPAEAITGYRVYTATRPGVRPDNGSLIDATPTHRDDGRWQLRHTGLQNGQRYYYVVSAQNAGGEGGLSREVWARPRVPAPGVPAGLSAEAGDGQVRIDFTPPDTLSDDESATYNLYWTRALTDEGGNPSGQRSPTEVISNVQPGYRFSEGADTNGTTYFFQVSAVSNGDEGPLSDEVSATPRLPAPAQAPQAAQTQADSGQVTLDWAPVAQASGYVIYWATDPDIDPRTSNRLRGEAIQPGFVHDGLENGQSYFYRVAAVNAGGEGSLSALLAAQPQVPPPTTPTGFSVQPGDGQVIIDFAPTPTATHYRVFWHPDVEAPLAQWSSRAVLPGDSLAGLSNGQTNAYRLQALNAGGESPLTEAVSATPQPKPPAPPTGLAVATGDGELSVNWHTLPGLHYTLYWSDDPKIAPIDSGNAFSDARPTYRHTGLNNEMSYYYQISARNSGGESPPSEPVQATPAGVMPGVPQALSAEGGQNQVTLRWLPPANATGTPQYTLYWSILPDQGINGTALTAVSSPYIHTGLNNNQRYYYVITATTDGVEGPASAQVEALSTGGAVPAQPQGVQGSTGDGQNTLQWQAVVDAGEYTVQWSTQADMSAPQGTTVSAPPFVHDEPPASTLYYRVIARNDNGDSPPSAIVKIVQDSPNQAPQITQGAVVSVTLDEDSSPTAFALSLNATDNDGDTLTWSIVTPAGRGSAQITGNNTSASVAYTPQADVNGSDTFTVQVNDGQGGTDSIQIDVSITPQNDAPTITNTDLSPSMGENTTAVTAITVADVDSSTFTYTLSGADSALFSMSGNTLAFITAPDFETPQDNGGDNVYNVSVTANDGSTDSTAVAFNITVKNTNDVIPQITNAADFSVPEQTTAVTAITVSDADSTAFTYTLGGVDSALFSLTGNTLAFVTAPNFESPQDSGGDNVYNVSVTANDGTNDSVAKAFVITVTDANDTVPVITNTDLTPSIGENTTTVTAITVTDADSTTFTYALSGADSALFSMAGNTLRFIAAPDFEAPQDSGADNVYNVSVTANDGTNDSAAKAFVITVTDANDTVPVITNINLSPSIGENTITVTAITVTDSDSTAFTYALSGADSALFSVAGNTLRFIAAPDFEAPQDSGTDNIYNVSVIANDGTNDSAAKAFVITVTDANDTIPMITNTNLAPSIGENTTTVTAITVTDSDSSTFTYVLSGADSALFSMAGNTLRFIAAPDFEAPQDNGGDNVYNVSVAANDGANNSAAKVFVITVTDANDTVPVITNSNLTPSIGENTTTVTAITVTDSDSSTFTYALSGADSALFSLAGNTLRFIAAPDFEVPQDSGTDNVYNVSVTANDGSNDSAAKAFVITVTNLNDNTPVFTSGTAVRVMENTTVTGYTATTTDGDGDTVTFSLSGGTDQAAFSIDNNSGVLSFNTAPSFANPSDSDGNNTYVVVITATDGTNPVVQSVTVTVTDIFEVTVSTTGIKTIRFDWPAYTGATKYKLFVNPDGMSGFTLLQDNLLGTSTTIELPVHLTDWVNASYLLEAHHSAGKLTESSPVSITAVMIDSIGYVKASNTEVDDYFGYAISLSGDGDTLAVGARYEDSNATGIDGDQTDNSAYRSGAVYVFSRSGSIWIQQAYVKASNTGARDEFGSAVSLSADGSTLAVVAVWEDSNASGINGDQSNNSATWSGAVYVFSRSGNTWTQQAYVKASNTGANDRFGSAVSLSADGNTLAVGAYYEDSSATGIDGDQTDNWAPGSGSVYVFSRSGSTWIQQAYVKASNTGSGDRFFGSGDQFGSSVSLSADGNTLAVGAIEEASNATGIDGDQTNNWVLGSGAVYVFGRSGGTWAQQAYVKASNTGPDDSFGSAVSLSSDGNTLAVVASREDSNATGIGGNQTDNEASDSGAVYVFGRSGSSWAQQAYVKASNTGANDRFGSAVSLSADGNTLAVGVRRERSNATGIGGDQTDNSASNSGAVYVFSRSGNTWAQQAYVKASNTGGNDVFGSAVSLTADGNTLAVGASGEASNATGIGGDQTDNSASWSGAVYLY